MKLLRSTGDICALRRHPKSCPSRKSARGRVGEFAGNCDRIGRHSAKSGHPGAHSERREADIQSRLLHRHRYD